MESEIERLRGLLKDALQVIQAGDYWDQETSDQHDRVWLYALENGLDTLTPHQEEH